MINVTLEEIKAMNISLNSPVEELRNSLLEAMLSTFPMEESLSFESIETFSVEYLLIVAKGKFTKMVEQINFHEAFSQHRRVRSIIRERLFKNFRIILQRVLTVGRWKYHPPADNERLYPKGWFIF